MSVAKTFTLESLARKCPACHCPAPESIVPRPGMFIRCCGCQIFLRFESDLSLSVASGAETEWLLKNWEEPNAIG